MAFLYPKFLWALLALAIPIIIHLFQLRRYKKLYFPNVRLLQEVQQQTRSQSRLKHLLVLAARLLALTFLVLAFAQPYLKRGDDKVIAGQRAVSVYVDDSFSMEAEGSTGRALDVARQAALDAVSTFSATDRFQVLTSRLEGRQQQLMGRDEALEDISQVEVGPFERPLSKVIARQREVLHNSPAPVRRAFIISDLQRGVMDVDVWSNDSTQHTVIVPVQADEQANLFIDSVWFATPVRRMGTTEQLNVRVRNTGDQDLENIPMRLSVNGTQRALATFSIPAGGMADTSIRFTHERAGKQAAVIRIDDHPIIFDDSFFLSYEVAPATRVLLVSGGSEATDRAVEQVFRGDSLHQFRTVPYRNIDLSLLKENDLIILNALPEVASGVARELEAFVNEGGSLWSIPGAESELSGQNELLASVSSGLIGKWDTADTRVSRIDLAHNFYRDAFEAMPRNVDLPKVLAHFDLRTNVRTDALLRLENGSAFLATNPHGQGKVFVSAAPLDVAFGNFIRHSFFVTSLLRMAETSRPSGQLAYTIGSEELIPIVATELGSDAVVKLKGADGQELIPEMRRMAGRIDLALHGEDLHAGHYWITLGADTLQGVALNYPRSGSDLDRYSVEELQDALDNAGLNTFEVLAGEPQDLSVSLAGLDRGVKLWKWCILLALIFLGFEVALIRWST